MYSSFYLTCIKANFVPCALKVLIVTSAVESTAS